MWWLAWKKGVYVWFLIPYFRSDPKVNTYSKYLTDTDLLTNWPTDYQIKLINEWSNGWMHVSSMLFWFLLRKWKKKKYFFKIPRLQCSNQGSPMMGFLLLSLESEYMIIIRAITGMQLISNEEKMLRWQTHGVFFSAVLRKMQKNKT